MAEQTPKSWASCRVGDVASVQLGKMLDKGKKVNGEFKPYLRNQNVRWGQFDLTDLYEMPFTKTELEKFSVREGDLLVCEGGEPGRSSIWTDGETDIRFQKALHRVRMTDAMLPEWLFYHLKLSAANGYLSQYFTGTTIKHFTRKAFLSYELNLPPLNEQRRIVAKIEELTARSRNAKQALDAIPPLLERFRQSVLAAAFRGDLTKQWRQQNPNPQGEAAPSSVPATELLKRIRQERRHRWEQDYLQTQKAKGKQPKNDKWMAKYKEPEPVDATDLPELPDGWCWASLKELADLQGGIQKGKKRKDTDLLREIPYLRVANVQRGFLDLTEVTRLKATEQEIEKLRLKEGDLLFNEGGDRDKLGRGWLWEGQIEECIHQNHVFRARLYSDEMPAELVSHYGNSAGKVYFMKHGSQTTNLASLSLTKLGQLPIPLMPLSEQKVLLDVVSTLLSQLDSFESAYFGGSAHLEKLDQSILAKAFRGELVPQDPNDEPEPAFVLLERIRAEREAAQPKKKRKKARK